MDQRSKMGWFAAIAVAGAVCGTEHAMSSPPPPAEVVVRNDAASTTDCPFGGAVVSSGLDDNRNGRLDDAEVKTRTMVCNAAPVEPPPVIRVRLVSEPSGPNCAIGGTAVQSGPDGNGNGQLDDDEVMHTDYVCGQALLTRLAAEPAGNRCAAGGVVFLAGRDRDADGELDDDEVEVTEISCGDRLERDVELRTDTDMRALQAVRVITGSLRIHHSIADISLPRLAQIGGALEIGEDGGLTISLPALQSVGGALAIRDNAVRSIDCPQLRHIGSLDLFRTALPDLAGLPALAEIAGDVAINNMATLVSADLLPTKIGGDVAIGFNPALERVQWTVHDRLGNVRVTGNDRLETLAITVAPRQEPRSALGDVQVASLARLAAIRLSANRARSIDLSGNAFHDLALDLGTVDNDVMIRDGVSPFGLTLSDPDHKGHVELAGRLRIIGLLDAFHASDDVVVEGLASFDGTQLRELAPVGSITVRGTLQLLHNSLLSLVAPIEIGGGLVVDDNALLPTLAFPRFALPGDVLGDVIVARNPVLAAAPALGSVSRVRGDVSIAFNPLLETAFGAPLVQIDGALSVLDNAAMTDLSLPNLAQIGAIIGFESNASLRTISLPALVDATHELFITSNPQLRHIVFDALTHAADFRVNQNPRLPTCEVLAVFAHVEGEHSQSGNDDTASCVR